MVCPDFEYTNSLLMKRPVGWEYFTPFGAVSWMDGALIVCGATGVMAQEFERLW